MADEKEITPISKQTRTHQPTYRLNPKVRFSAEKIERLLKRLVPAELEEVEYSDKCIPEICVSLSELVKQAVREYQYDR